MIEFEFFEVYDVLTDYNYCKYVFPDIYSYLFYLLMPIETNYIILSIYMYLYYLNELFNYYLLLKILNYIISIHNDISKYVLKIILSYLNKFSNLRKTFLKSW